MQFFAHPKKNQKKVIFNFARITQSFQPVLIFSLTMSRTDKSLTKKTPSRGKLDTRKFRTLIYLFQTQMANTIP